jgi:hypothetical protein
LQECSWYRQHEHIDRLNIQSHKNAIASSDEFVMNAFVIEDKVSIAQTHLLVDEATDLRLAAN